MIKELDIVILKVDLPHHRLKSGDVGTVVMVYNKGEAYEVEFVANDGTTIAVLTLPSKQVRSATGKKEIMHVRHIA